MENKQETIDDKINAELLKNNIDVRQIVIELIKDGYLTLVDEDEQMDDEVVKFNLSEHDLNESNDS